jgi:DNA-binding PadR family transcriptional regulator
LRRLQKKGFIKVFSANDADGNYDVVNLTNDGWEWIEANEDKFMLRKSQAADPSLPQSDDSPF